MDAAFQFDLMVTVGQAMNKLLSTGQWRQINYTDCFSFVSTDPKALLQATTLKEEIKKVINRIVIIETRNTTDCIGLEQWRGRCMHSALVLMLHKCANKRYK